jgi:hypothetical protein
MDYRRKSRLRSKQTASSPDNRLDRVVAISSIVSNIVIGVATVVLAGIGLYLTSEFNQWQKEDSKQSQQQVAFAVCISAAQLVFDAIKFRPEKDAANIIQTAVSSRSDCTQYGVNIPDLVATMVLKDKSNIDPKIVQRAAKRVAAVPEKSKREFALAVAVESMESIRKNQDSIFFLNNIELGARQSEVNRNFLNELHLSQTKSFLEKERKFNIGSISDEDCMEKADAYMKANPNELSRGFTCDDGLKIGFAPMIPSAETTGIIVF